MHDRISMLISFERDRLREFEQQCDEQKISVSEGVRQLVEQALEKNVESDLNPLNLSYNKQENKPLQTDLIQWFSHVDQTTEQNELNKIKGQALEIVRRSDKRSMELRMNGFTRR